VHARLLYTETVQNRELAVSVRDAG
jgi:hypothetical protein